jgi:hypothetical protein
MYRRTVAGFFPAFTSCSMKARIVVGSAGKSGLAAPFAERLKYRSVRFLRPQGVRRVGALCHPLPFPQAMQRRYRRLRGRYCC